jgi:hypothetical protein
LFVPAHEHHSGGKRPPVGGESAARQKSEDLAIMFEWFDRVGADADIAALRKDFSEVRRHSLADWARAFDWSVLERTSSVA